jgi:hypothetical protein
VGLAIEFLPREQGLEWSEILPVRGRSGALPVLGGASAWRKNVQFFCFGHGVPTPVYAELSV